MEVQGRPVEPDTHGEVMDVAVATVACIACGEHTEGYMSPMTMQAWLDSHDLCWGLMGGLAEDEDNYV